MSTGFSKSGNCPTSYQINAFQLGDCEPDEGRVVRLHLRECEFCAAESEFYARFPQPLEPSLSEELPAIPEPLRQLAEAILTNSSDSTTEFESLIFPK
jgi:hypothetical protein